MKNILFHKLFNMSGKAGKSVKATKTQSMRDNIQEFLKKSSGSRTDNSSSDNSLIYSLFLELLKMLPKLIEEGVKEAVQGASAKKLAADVKQQEDASKSTDATKNLAAKKKAANLRRRNAAKMKREAVRQKLVGNQNTANPQKTANQKRIAAQKLRDYQSAAPPQKNAQWMKNGNRQANANSIRNDDSQAAPTPVDKSKKTTTINCDGVSTDNATSKPTEDNEGYTLVPSSKGARRQRKQEDHSSSTIDLIKWKAAGTAPPVAKNSQGQTKKFLDKTQALIINPYYKETSDRIRNIFEIFSNQAIHIQKGCIRQFIKIVGETPSCPGLQRMIYLLELKRNTINKKTPFTFPSQEELEFDDDSVMINFLSKINKYYEIMIEAFYVSIHHENLKFDISEFKREFKKLPNFIVNQTAQRLLATFSDSLSSIRNANCHSEQAKQLSYIEMIKLVEHCANNAKQRFVKFGDIVDHTIPSMENSLNDITTDIIKTVTSLMEYSSDAANKFHLEFINQTKADKNTIINQTNLSDNPTKVISQVPLTQVDVPTVPVFITTVPAIPTTDQTRNCPPEIIIDLDNDDFVIPPSYSPIVIGAAHKNAKRTPSFSSDDETAPLFFKLSLIKKTKNSDDLIDEQTNRRSSSLPRKSTKKN